MVSLRAHRGFTSLHHSFSYSSTGRLGAFVYYGCMLTVSSATEMETFTVSTKLNWALFKCYLIATLRNFSLSNLCPYQRILFIFKLFPSSSLQSPSISWIISRSQFSSRLFSRTPTPQIPSILLINGLNFLWLISLGLVGSVFFLCVGCPDFGQPKLHQCYKRKVCAILALWCYTL